MKLWARAGVSLNIFLFLFLIFFLRTGGYRSLPSFQVAIRFRVGRYRRRPAEFVKRSRRENDGQAHSDRFFVLFFFFGGSVSFRSAIFFSFVLVLSSGPLPFSFLSLSLSLSISLSESQLLLLFTRHPLTASWTTIQPEEIHDISKKKQPEDLSETYYYFFF